MPTIKANDRPTLPPPEAGVQHAVCIGVCDLGTQPQSNPKFQAHRKVLLTWELPNQKIMVKSKDGMAEIELPRVISADYTMSLGTKANLRKMLDVWRGRQFTPEELASFDLSKLIGANGLISIVHVKSKDGLKTYANVSSMSPLMRGMPKLTPENKTLVYDLPSSGPITFPELMPEWVQNRIKNSEEYIQSLNPHQPKKGPTEEQMANRDGPDLDEDLPF